MSWAVAAIMRRARSDKARAAANSRPMPATPCSAGLSLDSPTPTDSLSPSRNRAVAWV